MKKVLLFSAALALAYTGSAQRLKVSAAREYYADNELLRARQAIDEAVAHPETKESAEAWLTRANIYQAILDNRELSVSVPGAMTEARASVLKTIQLNPRYDKDGVDILVERLMVTMLNQGVGEFQRQSYDTAMTTFAGVRTLLTDVGGVNRFADNAERQKKLAKISRNSRQLGAYAAFSKKDYATAATMLEELRKAIKAFDDKVAQEIYTYLIASYQQLANKPKFEEVVKEASGKFPTNSTFQNLQLSVAMEKGETAGIITGLESNPGLATNADLLYALGYTYNQMAELESKSSNADTLALAEQHYQKADEAYRKGIVVKDGARFNLGIGNVYYHRITQMQLKMTSLGSTPADNQKYEEMSKQNKQLMAEALPFFEKAASQYEAIGLSKLKDGEHDGERAAYRSSLVGLREIYGRLENNTKRIETNKKLEDLDR